MFSMCVELTSIRLKSVTCSHAALLRKSFEASPAAHSRASTFVGTSTASFPYADAIP